ncbi:MAG: Kelch repeat-containing protein [Candidatus Binataceae bacterium]
MSSNQMMRSAPGNRSIRTSSIIFMIGALAAMFFAAHMEHRGRAANGTSAAAVAAGNSSGVDLSSDAPSEIVINLPGPNQDGQVPALDAEAAADTFAIPVFRTRISMRPATAGSPKLSPEWADFFAVGSPGSAASMASGAGVASAMGPAPAANAAADGGSPVAAPVTNPDQAGDIRGVAGHSGWVLIAGGLRDDKAAQSRAELFDPGQMNFVATGSMRSPRAHFVAADLNSDQTLVAGGEDAQGNPLASAELYDPNAGTFSATGAMNTVRAGHTATAISGCGCAADGKILIVGGSSSAATTPLASAELYDPASKSFTVTGAMKHARAWHTASLIGSGALSGDILIAGGVGAKGTALASAEIYDPRTGDFTETAPMATARAYQTAAWLDPAIVTGGFAGQILVAGGWTGAAVSDSAEVFDPAAETFSPAGNMTVARAYQSAVLMPDGKVLIAGGQGLNAAPLASAEIFDPVNDTFQATSPMRRAHVGGVVSILPDTRVLVAGGRSGRAEVYNSATGKFTLTAKMPVDVAYAAGAVIAH